MRIMMAAQRLFVPVMLMGALGGCTRTIPLEKTSPTTETLTDILDKAKDRYRCFGYGISAVSEDLASSAARLNYTEKCGSGVPSVCEIHQINFLKTVVIACSSGNIQ